MRESQTPTQTFAYVIEATIIQWYEYYKDKSDTKMMHLNLLFRAIRRKVQIDETIVRNTRFLIDQEVYRKDWVKNSS